MSEQHGFLLPEPSWDLRVFVPDLQVERTMRVRGDMHIGGIMLRLVEELDVSIDWSDYALWWPKRNCWLTKTRQTLNHYGAQADTFLNFMSMHRPLRVQLPDLRYVDARIDFSVECFQAVKLLCKELGIRHPEELSFSKPLSEEHLKKNFQDIGVTPKQRSTVGGIGGGVTGGMANGNQHQIAPPTASQMDVSSTTQRQMNGGGSLMRHHQHQPSGYATLASQAGTIDTRSHSPDITSTLSRHASYRGFTSSFNSTMLAEDLKNLEISNSPHSPSSDATGSLLYPRNSMERGRLNAGWLDSHLSLYQQNIRDFDTLQLRFKYREFYDLNPKLDMARINQIYEQAKWSLHTKEVLCNDNELMLFRELQYRIQQQASQAIPDDIGNANDDIDAALTELQLRLEGGYSPYNTAAGGAPLQYNDQTRGYGGGRSAVSRILEASSQARNLSATESKLEYIRAWKMLPDSGIHTFVVKFGDVNKEEILGIGPDRLIRIDPSNGEHLRVWPFARMKTWRVNWDSRQVLVQSEDNEITFTCLSANCKIPHELIGGYVFLSMRSKESSQTLNEDLFHKLTSGWDTS